MDEKIIQIMPLRAKSVYLEPDGTLIRSDVFGLAVVEEKMQINTGVYETYTSIQPFEYCDGDNNFLLCEEMDNYLGLEFDLERPKDWSYEIKLKQDEENEKRKRNQRIKETNKNNL